MKIKFLGIIIAAFLLAACAGPPLVLHKLGAEERGRVVRLSYNNYYRNSYQVVIFSVDGVNIQKAGRVEVEEGTHTISYDILDNFTTAQGTDYHFSSMGGGEIKMNFAGGYSYLLGTAGRSKNIQIAYKMPL